MKAEDIEKRQCNRFTILYELYKLPAGQTGNVLGLSFEKGVKNGFFQEAFDYLISEGFAEGVVAKSKITHSGKKAIEYTVLNPTVRTEHFPPFAEMGL